MKNMMFVITINNFNIERTTATVFPLKTQKITTIHGATAASELPSDSAIGEQEPHEVELRHCVSLANVNL